MELLSHRSDDDVGEVVSFYLAVTVATVLVVLTVRFMKKTLLTFSVHDVGVPIINAHQPWSSTFDATQVWGPVSGAMAYVGIRIKFEKM